MLYVMSRHVTSRNVRFGSVRLCHVCARFMTFNVIKREIIEVYTSQMMKNWIHNLHWARYNCHNHVSLGISLTFLTSTRLTFGNLLNTQCREKLLLVGLFSISPIFNMELPRILHWGTSYFPLRGSSFSLLLGFILQKPTEGNVQSKEKLSIVSIKRHTVRSEILP